MWRKRNVIKWPRKIRLRSTMLNNPEESEVDFTTEMPSVAVISAPEIGNCLRGSGFAVMTAPRSVVVRFLT